MHKTTYETDDATFSANAYRVKGYRGVAWYVLGWKTQAVSPWFCLNCSCCGFERDGGGGVTLEQGDKTCDHDNITYSDEPEYERTGEIVAVMVGDDRRFTFDLNEISPLEREEYCGECGQIGCSHDGYAERA